MEQLIRFLMEILNNIGQIAIQNAENDENSAQIAQLAKQGIEGAMRIMNDTGGRQANPQGEASMNSGGKPSQGKKKKPRVNGDLVGSKRARARADQLGAMTGGM